MTPAEFRLLYAGMIDNLNPEATEPTAEKIARKVREAHLARAGKNRKSW